MTTERLGRILANWISTGIAIAAGYAWAKHGFVWCIAIIAAEIVVTFALIGVLAFGDFSKKVAR